MKDGPENTDIDSPVFGDTIKEEIEKVKSIIAIKVPSITSFFLISCKTKKKY